MSFNIKINHFAFSLPTFTFVHLADVAINSTDCLCIGNTRLVQKSAVYS